MHIRFRALVLLVSPLLLLVAVAYIRAGASGGVLDHGSARLESSVRLGG